MPKKQNTQSVMLVSCKIVNINALNYIYQVKLQRCNNQYLIYLLIKFFSWNEQQESNCGFSLIALLPLRLHQYVHVSFPVSYPSNSYSLALSSFYIYTQIKHEIINHLKYKVKSKSLISNNDEILSI